MPGSLVPGDLERIEEFTGNIGNGDFVMENFRVSDGAKVGVLVGGKLIPVSIPSLVPAQRPDGRCVFLTDDGKCSIHPVSPFGCSHVDTHMDQVEGDRRVQWCVQSQVAGHKRGERYTQLCILLDEVGLNAPRAAKRRAAFEAEFEATMQKEQRGETPTH